MQPSNKTITTFIAALVFSVFSLSAFAQPALPFATVVEWCGEKSINLTTSPGMVTAEMPVISHESLAGGAVGLIQSPEAGTRLEPGEFVATVVRADNQEVVCRGAGIVTLDPYSSAWPFFDYIPAGDGTIAMVGSQPALEIGALEDELGNPITMSIMVDGTPIAGADLSAAAAIYAMPGIHMTTIHFTDVFGRISEFFWSEWFQKALAQAFTGPQIGLGVTAGCQCELRSAVVAYSGSGGSGNGDGKASYSSKGAVLKNMSIEVTDRWGEPDSHSAADGSTDSDSFEIVCKTQNGTVQPVCTTCCPNPIIIGGMRATIGGLTAEAEDGTDKAMIKVTVSSSGFGKSEVQSWVASGFQSFELTRGVTLGAEIGVGAVDKALAMMPKLSAGASKSDKYSGDSYGSRSEAPIPNTLLTGWNKACKAENALNVTFSSEVLADVDHWEQFFGLTSDTSKAFMSSQSAIAYREVYFRCDGKHPEIGQN